MNMNKIASCECGKVQMQIAGEPIYNSACHCDDCQAGWGHIQSLEGAPAVVDDRGGIAVLFYRQNQVTFVKGEKLLQAYKLRPESPTSRYYAGCCNSSMFAQRDSSHWLAIIRDRLGRDAPPLARNHFTKFSTQQPFDPRGLPSHPKVPPGMIWKLITAEISGRLGR